MHPTITAGFRGIRCAILVFLLAAAGTASAADVSLSVKVVTSSENSLNANFTLLMGQRDMVLFDAPFTRADAHRLVAEMLETGKNLKTVYVTHDHPDHFFSMEVITQAFPNAQVISHPDVVRDIWASIPRKIERWGALLGDNGPRYPTAPAAWDSDHFELEGQRLEILGPMQGDHRNSMVVYIPSLKTLVAGDLVFHDVHVWLGETTSVERQKWIASLDRLAALKAETVIAGHKIPGLPDSPEAIRFTRDYIVAFDREARKARNSEELIAAMRRLYPDARDFLGDFILVESAKVGAGENLPWEE
jgi:glyoxylase-like metal-dependent hydrolase (beta-lactamase superfamily II)